MPGAPMRGPQVLLQAARPGASRCTYGQGETRSSIDSPTARCAGETELKIASGSLWSARIQHERTSAVRHRRDNSNQPRQNPRSPLDLERVERDDMHEL